MIATSTIIFIRLLAAHLLADFYLQRTSWIKGKKKGLRSVYLYYHIAVVGVLTYLLLGDWSQWQLPLFIMITHFIIDAWKTSVGDTRANFIIDQSLHIVMLIIGWAWYVHFNPAVSQQFWPVVSGAGFWIILTSYVIVLRPAGFLIEKLTLPWSQELDELKEYFEGLNNAGSWIGYLERLIIVTFILVGHYGAIGFLIAAKSIFRFTGKITKKQDRKLTEYILIGTLLSFALAILVGIAVRTLLY